jgi:hypothetical protein
MVKETKDKPKKQGNPNPKQLPPGPGRPKGIPNKMSRIAKENIETVFFNLGGVEAMAAWARDNQTEFYRHYAKLIPLTLAGDEKNPIALKDVTDIKSKLLKAIPQDQLDAILTNP